MRTSILLPVFLSVGSALAQSAPSDSLFSTDQVVTIDLTFADPNFWSLLTTYYTNDLGETLTGNVTITDNTGIHTYPDVAVDLKGNSSYGHPGNKKSFKIDFNDNVQGQKYHGMTKVHFNNCFKDPTFMREKLFFDFSREQGVLAPRVLYANVTMNGTFWGFYDMVEAVDKNFLDRWVDDNDGNLFKAGDNFGMGGTSAADLAFYGTDPANYTDRYELKTNEVENDRTDLIALLEELNTASDADLISQFPAHWEWAPMLRSLAIDNLFSNLDSYINSARNYYVYHDSTTFLWNWIKWDANEAFGVYTGGPGTGNLVNLAPNYMAASRPLLAKIMGIPEFYSDYLVEYCAALDAFSNAQLDPKIDALTALIQSHVAADPNKQYTLAQFNTNINSDISVTGGGPGGQQTVPGLKSFISARNGFLSGALDCSTVAVDEFTRQVSISLFPNPVSEQLYLRLPGNAQAKDVSIHDMLGRRAECRTDGRTIDVSALAPGIYVVTLGTNDGIVTARFRKE